MIFENASGQVEMNFTSETFAALKDICLTRYKKLADTYIRKEDASNFLFEFVIFEDGTFLPKDEKVRDFVKRYYGLYEKWGNVLEEVSL